MIKIFIYHLKEKGEKKIIVEGSSTSAITWGLGATKGGAMEVGFHFSEITFMRSSSMRNVIRAFM